MEWTREAVRRIEPIKVGHYIGETDLTADVDRARRSFAQPNWQRLQRLQRQYDPDGIFHGYLTPTEAGTAPFG